MIQLLKSGYNIKSSGNIVFVCGGNDATHMRPRFCEYCAINYPDIMIFWPEYAMADYFSSPSIISFDISDFEELVSEVSHSIILFPEAPGSFAETGYFSALNHIALKTILVLDLNRQASDSFISMGPAKKIGSSSQFSGVMQTPYDAPAFGDIIARLNRVSMPKNKKILQLDKFSTLKSYDKFCLIYACVKILAAVTLADILFVFRSIFKSHISEPNIKQLTSILVGAKYLVETGSYGHLRTSDTKKPLAEIREGKKAEEAEIKLMLANAYMDSDPEFLEIIEEAKHAS
ncbi:MAG: hypothetical protein FD176_2657 [Rhodospirillaceae bacterium]|nr:MAG: hypothetical protein FD176_2657 [Rhodospirillaceae bacterium]TNC96347.1 MAG: hypothetical protein FD119_1654 [Stygiobacter sp.]